MGYHYELAANSPAFLFNPGAGGPCPIAALPLPGTPFPPPPLVDRGEGGAECACILPHAVALSPPCPALRGTILPFRQLSLRHLQPGAEVAVRAHNLPSFLQEHEEQLVGWCGPGRRRSPDPQLLCDAMQAHCR